MKGFWGEEKGLGMVGWGFRLGNVGGRDGLWGGEDENGGWREGVARVRGWGARS